MKTIKVNLVINSLAIALLCFTIISCEQQLQEDNFSSEPISESNPNLKSTAYCTVDLIAAQQFVIGNVTTEFNDAGDVLTVTYLVTDNDWCLIETHLDVQSDPDNFPQTNNGNPKVGHFAFGEELNCAQSWVEIVELDNIEDLELGMTLYIASHAEVLNNESAWGEGESFPGNSWAMYFECEPPAEWECGDPIIDERDGQSYNTVQIGDQCWLKENLNIGIMVNVTSNQYNNGTIEKYCYNNNPSNCATYGGLYQWDELMQYVTTPATQGICPSGWHIPTDNEWKILEGTVDSQYGIGDPVWNNRGNRGFDAGLNLKSITGWINNGNGIDLYGFNALPTGFRSEHGYFAGFGNRTNIASSNEINSDDNERRQLHLIDGISRPYYNDDGKESGQSVRCLKDD